MNGHPSGFGRLMAGDGSYYIGYFKDIKAHGYGKFFRPDGTFQQGLFYEAEFMDRDKQDNKHKFTGFQYSEPEICKQFEEEDYITKNKRKKRSNRK